MKKSICEEYPISDSEYQKLDRELGSLAKYAAWQLLKKNAKNNHTDDFDDINQELLMSLIRAGSYYKRQIYIEQCLITSLEYVGTSEAIEFLQHIATAPEYKSMAVEAQSAANRALQRGAHRSQNRFMTFILQELVILWHNRTRHGANRQKFGGQQEKFLHRILFSVVPSKERPNKNAPLSIDTKFSTYAKAIAWNSQKSMGRKITREKSIRTQMVSLSEHSHLS